VHISWRPEKGSQMTDVEYRSARQPRAGTDEKGPQTFHPTRIGIEKKGDAFQLYISWQGEPLHAEGAPVGTIAFTDEITAAVAQVEALKGGALRDLSDQLRQREGAQAVVLASADEGKVALVVNLDNELSELDAVQIVRELGLIIGGGGGGRRTLAEAGGKNVDAVRDALTAGRDRLTAVIG